LAIQSPGRPQPSIYRIKGGDAAGLMAQLLIARDRCTKATGEVLSITLCYEIGCDAFWLARFLMARGVECLVVDPASLKVDRRGRRAKTDRIDVGMLLRALMAWLRGDRRPGSRTDDPSGMAMDQASTQEHTYTMVPGPDNGTRSPCQTDHDRRRRAQVGDCALALCRARARPAGRHSCLAGGDSAHARSRCAPRWRSLSCRLQPAAPRQSAPCSRPRLRISTPAGGCQSLRRRRVS